MDDVLGRLERLEAEATPGEWKIVAPYADPDLDDDERCGWAVGTTHSMTNLVCFTDSFSEEGSRDALLIAESRNALPALLEVARAARRWVEARRAHGPHLPHLPMLDQTTCSHMSWGSHHSYSDVEMMGVVESLARLDALKGGADVPDRH